MLRSQVLDERESNETEDRTKIIKKFICYFLVLSMSKLDTMSFFYYLIVIALMKDLNIHTNESTLKFRLFLSELNCLKLLFEHKYPKCK